MPRTQRYLVILLPIGLTILLVLCGCPVRAEAQAAQLQLAWIAPTTKIDGTPLTDLAGYKLYYGRTSRQYEATALIGNQTSYTLVGLTAGQIYYVAVAAYNTAGHEGPLSEEISATPLPDLESFVIGFYRYGLGREPSSPEVSAWVAYLEANPTLAGASTLVHAAFDGPEYRSRPVTLWSHATALYQTILGRAPQPAELAYGVEVLRTQINAILPLFVQSAEFQHLLPDCQDPSPVAALITRLYQQALGRTPSPGEVLAWTNYLVGTCDLDGVVEAFFSAGEYLSIPRTLTQHVSILYHTLLAREADPGGLEGWVNYLAGQLALDEDTLMASMEFQAYFNDLFQ